MPGAQRTLYDSAGLGRGSASRRPHLTASPATLGWVSTAPPPAGLLRRRRRASGLAQRATRNNAWLGSRQEGRLQRPIDRPAPGFGDTVSSHIDHLTVGLYPLSRNCYPAHAQELRHHLRGNLVGNERRLGDAKRSGIREKLKDASTVVVERDRVQLWLRGRGGQSRLDSIG